MSILKNLLSGSPRASIDNDTVSPRSPSFNEMSMGTIEDHADYLKAKNDPEIMNSPEVKNPSSIKPGKLGEIPSFTGSSPARGAVWQSVFNPGRNFNANMKNQGSQYWDHVEGDKAHHASIWDHVLHSDRRRNFDELDKNKDGFLTSDDLTSALGHTEDVKQLIAAADKNNDGKIDRNEFNELLRNSTIAR